MTEPTMHENCEEERENARYALASGLAGMVVGWWFSKRDEERSEERGAR